MMKLEQLLRNFNEAINIINNQSKSKDLFMRNMMHELKNSYYKGYVYS